MTRKAAFKTAPKVQRLRGRDPAIEAPSPSPFLVDSDLLHKLILRVAGLSEAKLSRLSRYFSCDSPLESKDVLGILSHEDGTSVVNAKAIEFLPHELQQRIAASVRLKPFSIKQTLSFFGR